MMTMNDVVADLLLVDDDEIFCRVLSRALQRRKFNVIIRHDVNNGIQALEAMRDVQRDALQYAIVDLNMPGASGLSMVSYLHQMNPQMRILVLTGFASIATAIEAIKLGATHYLSKPADVDEILESLSRATGDASAHISEQTMSTKRLEWEHIQKVMLACDGNISAAARQLGMHRRTLQRKLSKKPVKQ